MSFVTNLTKLKSLFTCDPKYERTGGEKGRRKKGEVLCAQECLLRGIYPDLGNKTKTCLKNGGKIIRFFGLFELSCKVIHMY